MTFTKSSLILKYFQAITLSQQVDLLNQIAVNYKNSETLAFLTKIAIEDKHSVGCEAVKVIVTYFLDNSETFSCLKTLVMESKNDSIAEICLQQICQHFKDHPDLFIFLQSFLGTDQRTSLRIIAFKPICDNFKDNLELCNFLKQIIIENQKSFIGMLALCKLCDHLIDKNELFYYLKSLANNNLCDTVSICALGEICRHFKNDYKTFNLLIRIAHKNQFDLASETAIDILYHRFLDKSQIFSLLKNLLLEDKSKPSLTHVLWLIANKFEDHPETLSLLKTVALTTKFEEVASESVREIALLLGNNPQVMVLESSLRSFYIYRGVIIPPEYGKMPLEQWQPRWLLTEANAEVKMVLIQAMGYEKICQELNITTRDTYREYSLITLDNVTDVELEEWKSPEDEEPILLLKMTCPSTGHIHVLRVPPDIDTAREAITWVNWDIDPEEFAIET